MLLLFAVALAVIILVVWFLAAVLVRYSFGDFSLSSRWRLVFLHGGEFGSILAVQEGGKGGFDAFVCRSEFVSLASV